MKVSIVIPTYKRVDYLKRLLDSICAQTFKGYEVIVVDDCSPNWDEYLKLFDDYSKRISEFRYFQNKVNSGAPTSRNVGIKNAKYELVALVDDDDEWLPQKLEKQLESFTDEVGLSYTWTDAVNGENIVHRYRSEIVGDVRKDLLKECFIPSPSVLIRKSILVELGGFDPSLPSCQDWDMWTRISLSGHLFTVVKEVLTIYHKHDGESIGLSKRAKEGYFLYYKKHFFEFIKTGNWRQIIFFIKLGVKRWLEQ